MGLHGHPDTTTTTTWMRTELVAASLTALLSLATATHTRAALQLRPSAAVRARHRCVVLQAEPTASRRGRLRFAATRGPASWLETKDGPWSPGYWVEIEGGPDDGRDVVIDLADVGPGLKEGNLCCVVLGEDGSRWRCVALDDPIAPGAAQPAPTAAWRAIAQQAARPLSVVAATVALGVCLSQSAPRPSAQESLLRCPNPSPDPNPNPNPNPNRRACCGALTLALTPTLTPALTLTGEPVAVRASALRFHRKGGPTRRGGVARRMRP